jgi:N-dimethylarginine dimethylaminohydrolase
MTKSSESPYVRSDAGALAGAIVCAPSASVDRLHPRPSEPFPIADRALEQHRILVRTLRDRGVDVVVLEPATETPTESLVADCAIVLPHGAVLARPSAVERRAEVLAVERALLARGIPIAGRIDAPGLLDATDVVLAGERVFIGVPHPGGALGPRSNALGRRQLAAIAAAGNLQPIELAMAAEVPRLRNVFNLVAADAVVAAPDMVDLVPVRDLHVIEVPRGEEFAAGVLAFGERRAIVNLRFRESIGLLRAAKVEVEAIDLWEFGKAGIGPFQLVLATNRG